MIICCDLDNCLICPPAVKLASSSLNYEHREEDASDWTFSIWPEELRQQVFKNFTDPAIMCDQAMIIEGAQAKIREWTLAGHFVYVITARDAVLKEKTLELVKKNFPEVIETILVGFNESKNDTLKSLECDLFIDDSPFNIENSQKLGIKSIMISNKYTTYNHHMRDKVEWYKCIGDMPDVV